MEIIRGVRYLAIPFETLPHQSGVGNNIQDGAPNIGWDNFPQVGVITLFLSMALSLHFGELHWPFLTSLRRIFVVNSFSFDERVQKPPYINVTFFFRQYLGLLLFLHFDLLNVSIFVKN